MLIIRSFDQDVKEALRIIELYEKEYKPKGLKWIIAEQFPVSYQPRHPNSPPVQALISDGLDDSTSGYMWKLET